MNKENKYLDLDGLTHYDEKLKEYIEIIFGTKQEIYDAHEWVEMGQNKKEDD